MPVPTSRDSIYDDYIRHGRSLTDPGLWALAVWRFGNWASTIPVSPLRWFGSKMYGGATILVQATTGNLLHREVKLGTGTNVGGSRNVMIHPDVEIGDRCRILSSVSLGTNERFKPGVPKIGDDVVIEAGAKVLGGVVIGDRAVIKANSLVLTNVPADAVAVGVPAKVTTQVTTPPRTQG
jgi:serine O-acetyltransferase